MEEQEQKHVDEEWKQRVASEAKGEAASDAGERPPLPEANLKVFVSTLATQALVHLGFMESPVTGKRERDLEQAKYTIDLLQVLKDKTKGNLDADEQRLLDGYLYDLRMRYVEASR
jgi:hypothetical protein